MALSAARAQVSPEPPKHCPLCPRLVAFRKSNQDAHPDWFNGAVPSFGAEDARLLIVGLAPGLKGANRTGRPFLGDFAGELLYRTLLKVGLARGHHAVAAPEALELVDCMISTTVRCVPPQNKPTGDEIKTCRDFLAATIDEMPKLGAVLALGRIAHDSLVTALAVKRAAHPFKHGGAHDIGRLRLFSSYHCSRYNTNTGVLTTAMFHHVFAEIRSYLDSKS
jgi:uracil-DNA glycosylase family 4